MIKIQRINSELQKQIALIIDNEIRNPLIHEGMVTVTSVAATPDLKYAKVFLSIYCSDAEQKQEVFKAIVGAGIFIRNKLKGAMNIRLIPDLTFIIDNSIDYGMKIDKILRTLK
ncbi:MAG: 30S ribosome-binding factor RbfA [Clostridia bacterium]|nr:30S ribosome-binding factor RbfA [Clostridia bacterium]